MQHLFKGATMGHWICKNNNIWNYYYEKNESPQNLPLNGIQYIFFPLKPESNITGNKAPLIDIPFPL